MRTFIEEIEIYLNNLNITIHSPNQQNVIYIALQPKSGISGSLSIFSNNH